MGTNKVRLRCTVHHRTIIIIMTTATATIGDSCDWLTMKWMNGNEWTKIVSRYSVHYSGNYICIVLYYLYNVVIIVRPYSHNISSSGVPCMVCHDLQSIITSSASLNKNGRMNGKMHKWMNDEWMNGKRHIMTGSIDQSHVSLLKKKQSSNKIREWNIMTIWSNCNNYIIQII